MNFVSNVSAFFEKPKKRLYERKKSNYNKKKKLRQFQIVIIISVLNFRLYN